MVPKELNIIWFPKFAKTRLNSPQKLKHKDEKLFVEYTNMKISKPKKSGLVKFKNNIHMLVIQKMGKYRYIR